MLARLQTLSALWELRQGNQQEAIEKIFSVVRLGHIIQKSQGAMIEYLVGVAVKDIGLSGFAKALPDLRFSSQDFSHVVQEILGYNGQESKTGLEKTWRGEYMFGKYVFTKLARKGIPNDFLTRRAFETHLPDPEKVVLFSTHDFFFQPMRTLHFFEGLTRNRIENMYKFCNEIRPYGPLEEIAGENVHSPGFWLRQNPMGRIWILFTAAEIHTPLYRKCAQETKTAAIAAAFALKSYQLEKGTPSLNLRDLAPDFLAEAPADAFDGGPLRYNPEKRIVYSPGKDLVDDGGDKEKDIVVEF